MSVAKRSSAPGRITRASSRQLSRPIPAVASGGASSARIGEQDEGPRDRGGPGSQRRTRAGIVVHAGEHWRARAPRSRRSTLHDAVLERLAADQADVADCARACQRRCSPPPKPISSHTSRDRGREQSAQASPGQACRDRDDRRGSSSASSACLPRARLAPCACRQDLSGRVSRHDVRLVDSGSPRSGFAQRATAG